MTRNTRSLLVASVFAVSGFPACRDNGYVVGDLEHGGSSGEGDPQSSVSGTDLSGGTSQRDRGDGGTGGSSNGAEGAGRKTAGAGGTAGDTTGGADGSSSGGSNSSDSTASDPGESNPGGSSVGAAGAGPSAAGGAPSPLAGGAAGAGAGAGGGEPVGECEGEYLACGCGCCGGGSETLRCYYPGGSQTLASIREADRLAGSSPDCANMGCFMGQRYVCCMTDAAAAASATGAEYTASFAPGGYDRVTFTKTAGDGHVAEFSLYSFDGATSEADLEFPTGWSLELASVALEGTAVTSALIGGQGAFSARPDGSGCAIDLDLTLFFQAENGTVVTEVFAAEEVQLAIDWLCS